MLVSRRLTTDEVTLCHDTLYAQAMNILYQAESLTLSAFLKKKEYLKKGFSKLIFQELKHSPVLRESKKKTSSHDT